MRWACIAIVCLAVANACVPEGVVGSQSRLASPPDDGGTPAPNQGADDAQVEPGDGDNCELGGCIPCSVASTCPSDLPHCDGMHCVACVEDTDCLVGGCEDGHCELDEDGEGE